MSFDDFVKYAIGLLIIAFGVVLIAGLAKLVF